MFETSICIVPSSSHAGGFILSIIVSNRQCKLSDSSFKSIFAIPFFADANTTGKSSWSSFAFSSINSSSTSSTTFSGFAPGLSILFTTTIGFKFNAKDFLSTSLVWGIAPSNASTNKTTPSTIFNTRSTSPPKSACPGVSTMFILISLYITDVFLAKIVIPLSFSRSFESITLSATCSLSRKTWLCLSMASTNVVLPWSTCAIIAIFLIFWLFINITPCLCDLTYILYHTSLSLSIFNLVFFVFLYLFYVNSSI